MEKPGITRLAPCKSRAIRFILIMPQERASITYKLMLSGGIKSVQGDTDNAQASMVTEQYAHILDDNRRINTERF